MQVHASESKVCTKCNSNKPLSEFYVKQVRSSGYVQLDSKCKACAKDIVARRRSKRRGVEYKKRVPLMAKYCDCGDQISVSMDSCKICRAASRYGMTKEAYAAILETHGIEWVKAASIKNAKAKHRSRDRLKHKRNPWLKKCAAVVSGMRSRLKQRNNRAGCYAKPVGNAHLSSVITDKPHNWKALAIIQFEKIDKLSRSRRERRYDPWRSKCDTTARNWRRKLRDGKHARSTGLA